MAQSDISQISNLLDLPPSTPGDDVLQADFLADDYTTIVSISDWTEFNLERDFFNPADAFTLVLEDDRAQQLQQQLFEGMAVNLSIISKGISYTFMTGYIFSYHYETDRVGRGQRLTIMGQDLLGWMNKSVCPPNLGNTATNTNFHFKPDTLISDALQTIFNAFASRRNLSSIQFQDFEDKSFTLATGGAQGLKQPKSGKGRGLQKSLQRQLNHKTTPNDGETYLQYAIRLAKHVGQNIKMQNGLAPNLPNQIIQVTAPTYDPNNDEYLYQLVDVEPQPNVSYTISNNILAGSLKIDIESQPSVIVVEKATSGNNTFYQSSRKVIVVNELTGYPRQLANNIVSNNQQRAQFDPDSAQIIQDVNSATFTPIQEVQDFISQLVNKYNYLQIKTNYDLYAAANIFTFQVNNQVQTNISSPAYHMDLHAHTDEELQFSASMLMAEAQDKYLTLNYSTTGFSQNGKIWTTNRLCYVYDDQIGIKNLFWIRKVNFTLSRGAGAITHLELTLPYTHLGLEPIINKQPVASTPKNTTKPDYNANLYYNGKIVTGFDNNGNPITQ